MTNNKSEHRKTSVLSLALALSLLASSCAKPEDVVTVTIKDKRVDEDVKPTIEIKEEVTWAQFDENTLMYKVDLDKFLKDKLKLSNEVLGNSDVISLMEMVCGELGEDFYAKDEGASMLYNLDGKSVTISASQGVFIYVKFYESEDILEGNSLVYNIDVSKNGKTISKSKSREEGLHEVQKYYIIYSGNTDIEYARTIYLRADYEKYLSISIHARGTVVSGAPSLSFYSDMADATIRLSDEEYATLYELMLSYSDSDNLCEFLSDNIDLLNKYLDLIKEESPDYYEYLRSLINEFIGKGRTLR